MTMRYPCCAQAKGLRIRQGSPQEEAALAQHLRELAVSPRQAQEMGQLAELLILLGEWTSRKPLENVATLLCQYTCWADLLPYRCLMVRCEGRP